jgi:hypothetical protein
MAYNRGMTVEHLDKLPSASRMSDRPSFASRLGRFSAMRRGLRNAALAYRLGAMALTAGAAALLILSGWLPGAFVNLALFAVLAVFLLGLAGLAVRRWTRFRSYLDEAFRIERLAGGLNSRVVSAWDFLDRGIRTPLTQSVIARAAADLDADHESRLDRGDRNRQRGRFLGRLTIFLLLGLTPWFGFGRLAANFDRTLTALRDYLFPLQYVMVPGAGRHVYRLGQPVAVSLEFQQRAPEAVRLVSQVGEETRRTQLALDATGRILHTITSAIEAEYVVHFEFGDRSTAEATLVFATPPTVVNMQTELVYPPYTRLLPRSLESVQTRLLGLPGTRMTLGFTFSKDLESAVMTWDDGQQLPLETVGRFATVSLVHNRARQASLQVRDRDGFSLDAPLIIDFEVQTDERPQLFLPRHLKEDMPLLEPAARQFGFGVQAQDDYGVTRLVLKWQKSTVDSSTNIRDRGEVERLISPEQPKVVVNFEKVFETLDLKPGDKISFQVEAYDNRAPQRQVTVSRRCSFFVFQEALADLSIKELGFGGGEFNRERIAKSTRATAVKEPEGLRTKEQVKNDFEANVISRSQAPMVRGEHAQATRDYFRLLSGVKNQDEDKPAGAARPAR